jgi:murein DD-endopeptidase MepM/ murein hydrolase activator NlpD
MRFVAVLLVMVALILPLATPSQAATDFPSGTTTASLPAPQAQNCGRAQTSMAQIGAPSAQARLLASASAPQQQVGGTVTDVYVVRPGDTLSKIAAQFGTTVQAIMQANHLTNPNYIYSGQRLYIPGAAVVTATAGQLADPLFAAWIDGEAIQGESALIWLRATPGTTVYGTLRGWEGNQHIPFYRQCDLMWGLVSFDALRDTAGIYNLNLQAKAPDGRVVNATVPVTLRNGSYPMDEVIQYPSDRQRLLDPNLIRAENQRLNNLFASLPYSAPRWAGTFRKPLDSYVTNMFGYRGSVNGVPTGYHEGIDLRTRSAAYPDGIGVPIPSSAPGFVVLAEQLTVRGGTVFVDHGAGVVTGYFHMSAIDVKVGDWVDMGTIVGRSGLTGLTSGPHLHWEMRVNGRWVNPMVFVNRSIP